MRRLSPDPARTSALFNRRKAYAVLKTELKELVGKLVQLQMERATWGAELVIKDSRIARTIELGAILESQGKCFDS